MSIQKLISTYEHQLDISEYIDAIGCDIEQLYIDKFWNNISDDKWIYIDDDMLKWIGYKSENNEYKLKKRYIQLLENNFTEDEEYKYLNASEIKSFYEEINSHEETAIAYNTHNKVKHILVAPDCFKESLMLIQTDRSKQIRKYYLSLERVFKSYLNYCNAFKDKLIAIEKSKTSNLIESISDIKQLEKTGRVYIATSKYNANKMIFKVGQTSQKPKQRLQNYNTVALEETETYYCQLFECHNPALLESILHTFLKPFQYKNELFQLPYDSLVKIFKQICSDYDNHYNMVNEYIEYDYKNQLTAAKANPAPIDLVQINEQVIKDNRFTDNHSENIFIYNGIKLYLCPRCNDYVCTSSNALYQHYVNRVVKCLEQPKTDMNNTDHVQTLITKNNIKVYSCTDCNKAFTHQYLLNNHYKSTTKCIGLEEKSIVTEVKITSEQIIEEITSIKATQTKPEIKVASDTKNMLSSKIIDNLCNLYNYEDEPSEDIIQFMNKSKVIIDTLQVVRDNEQTIDPVVESILNHFNVQFDFQSLSITNNDEIKYLSAKDLAAIFATTEAKSLYSINNNIRKLLKPYHFNLNSTRLPIDGSKKRIEYYFITFNCMNISYIAKTKLNKQEVLDDIIFYINDKNKVSIKVR